MIRNPNQDGMTAATAIVLCVIAVILFALFMCSVKTRDDESKTTMNHLGEHVGGHRVDER